MNAMHVKRLSTVFLSVANLITNKLGREIELQGKVVGGGTHYNLAIEPSLYFACGRKKSIFFLLFVTCISESSIKREMISKL
jgi:hypothetical protein